MNAPQDKVQCSTPKVVDAPMVPPKPGLLRFTTSPKYPRVKYKPPCKQPSDPMLPRAQCPPPKCFDAPPPNEFSSQASNRALHVCLMKNVTM
jgi:hypothetical protein